MPDHDPAEAERLFTFEALERSYRECRRRKRGTRNALRFEQDLEANLLELAGDLQSGRYRPRRSVCFVALKPKCREISAADFRDRVVHHLLVRLLEPICERVFIHDSFASRKGKGTHAAVERLKAIIPKVTRNHTVKAWYAHLDIRSFFASIDHDTLLEHLARRAPSPTVQWLCERIVRRDIALDAVLRGPRHLFDRVPAGKSLLRAPAGKGLPIGNHTTPWTTWRTAPLGARVKRARIDSVYHAHPSLVDFDSLHQSRQDFPLRLPIRILEPVPDSLGELLHASDHQAESSSLLLLVDRRLELLLHVLKAFSRTSYPRFELRFLQKPFTASAASRSLLFMGDLLGLISPRDDPLEIETRQQGL